MPDLKTMSDEEVMKLAMQAMSDEELLELIPEKDRPGSLSKKIFGTIGGALAGVTNIPGLEAERESVGRSAVDIGLPGAVPVTAPESFRQLPVMETLGGAAGGVAGFGAGGAGGFGIGAIPGAIAGGTIGSAVGRAADEGLRKLVGVSDVKSGADLAKKVGVSAGLGAVGEVIPTAVRPLMKKAFAPVKTTVSPQAERVLKFFANKTRVHKAAKKTGSDLVFNKDAAGIAGLTQKTVANMEGPRNLLLRPAQATDVTESSGIARLIDIADNMSSGSIFGSADIARHAKQSTDVVIESIDELFDGITKSRLTPNELGLAITANLDGVLTAKRQATNRLYSEINDRVRTLFETVPSKKISAATLNQATEKVGIVDISGIKSLSKKLQKIQMQLGSLASEEQGFNLAADVLSANDNLTFEAAKSARSGLLSLAGNRTLEGKNDAAVGLAKTLVGQIDEAIESALKKHDPKALKLWRKANLIYKSDTKQYDSRFIRKLMNFVDDSKAGNSSDVVKTIFQPDNIDEIRKIKRAVDVDTFDKARGWFVRSLFEDSIVPIGKENSMNIIDGKTLKKNIARYGKGRVTDALGVIFTPKEARHLKIVADAIELMGAKQGDGTGTMFIQLTQAAALVGVATGHGTPLSPILIFPKIFGKFFTNPKTARLLMEGYKLSELGLGTTHQFQAVINKLGLQASNLMKEEKQRKVRSQNRRLQILNK